VKNIIAIAITIAITLLPSHGRRQSLPDQGKCPLEHSASCLSPPFSRGILARAFRDSRL